MSRFGAKRGKKTPGAEFAFNNEPGAEPDTAPTPLFPVCFLLFFFVFFLLIGGLCPVINKKKKLLRNIMYPE